MKKITGRLSVIDSNGSYFALYPDEYSFIGVRCDIRKNEDLQAKVANMTLGDTVTVTGEADGSFTVNVSTLSYVRSVLDNPNSREDAKNALCALYRFCEAVKNYRP